MVAVAHEYANAIIGLSRNGLARVMAAHALWERCTSQQYYTVQKQGCFQGSRREPRQDSTHGCQVHFAIT